MLIFAQAGEDSKDFGSQSDWTRGRFWDEQKQRGPQEGDTQFERGDKSSLTHCSLENKNQEKIYQDKKYPRVDSQDSKCKELSK